MRSSAEVSATISQRQLVDVLKAELAPFDTAGASVHSVRLVSFIRMKVRASLLRPLGARNNNAKKAGRRWKQSRPTFLASGHPRSLAAISCRVLAVGRLETLLEYGSSP